MHTVHFIYMAWVAFAKARLQQYICVEFDHVDVVVFAAGHGHILKQ